MPRTAAGEPSVKKSRLASTSIGSTLLHLQQATKLSMHASAINGVAGALMEVLYQAHHRVPPLMSILRPASAFRSSTVTCMRPTH